MKLDLKYRPREFSDVVGQKAVSVVLSAMIAKNALSPVLLFTGPSGVGKTSMARIIAAQLNSEGAQEVHEGTHPAVLEIDAASNGSVERIRQLKKDLNYAVPGHRVVILDEVHAVSDEGFTALLNLLEFPPPNLTIILITTESHKIKKAIRHRCEPYAFKKASVEDLVARLRWVVGQENITITDDLTDLIAQRSEGSYREALMLLNKLWVAEITTVAEYNELQGEVDFGPTLIRKAMDGPVGAITQLESVLRYSNTEEVTDRTVEVLKDIMVLKGGNVLQYGGQALEARLELAAKLGTDQILKAIRIIWDLQTKLNAGDAVRGLELAFSLIGDVLQTEKPIVTVPTNSGRLSFEAMKRQQG